MEETEQKEDWKVNAQLAARHLRTIGGYEDNQFKRMAFFHAAEKIEELGERLGSYFPDKFQNIEGVGKSIAQVLKDLFTSGTSVRAEVARVELEKKGMIKHKKGGDVIRRPVETVMPMLDRLWDGMMAIEGIKNVVMAGSIRRDMPFVADADFVVVAENMEARAVAGKWLTEKGENGSQGLEQSSAVFEGDFQIDLNFCEEKEFGCQLLHSTGSKEHNIKMRAIAKAKGYKLNQSCVENVATGEKHYFKDERAVFEFLGIPYVTPGKRS